MSTLSSLYREIKERYLREHPCQCGESDVRCLITIQPRPVQFRLHHAFKTGVSLERFQEELYRSKVTCSNCHERETRKCKTYTYSTKSKLCDEYLAEHPCVDCGEDDVNILEFDHVRGQKYFNIKSSINSNTSISSLIHEIEKCDVRCSNCHMKVTYERNTKKYGSRYIR